MTHSEKNTKTAAIVCGTIAILFMAILVLAAVVKGQEVRDYSGKADVAFVADFHCPHCDSEVAYLKDLRWTHPGLHVDVFVVGKERAKELGITAFPTTVVGERVVGFGDDERDTLRREISR